MFGETDEILIWAQEGRSRKVYKMKLEATTKNKYIDFFNQGINKFLYDEQGEELNLVEFSASYKLGDEDAYKISSFIIPTEIKEAMDSTDTLESFVPKETGCNSEGYSIKAILIGTKDDKGNYYIACQQFKKNQILLRQKFNLILAGDTFKEEVNKFYISASDDVDCFFTENCLVFKEYYNANRVFDLSEYYRAATSIEIEKFKNSEIFYVVEDYSFGKIVGNISMRKKIAKILDSGVLSNISSADIKTKADELKVRLSLNADNKIVMPTDKKELKSLLAFFAEELYKGTFSQKTYYSNSTREINN